MFRKSGLLIVFTILALLPAGAQAQMGVRWEPSPYDGEAGVAAMGCSPVFTDDVWTCLVVRCDPAGLNVYVDMVGGSRLEEWVLDVDGQKFPIQAKLDLAAPYYNLKILGEQRHIIDALKSGTTATINYDEQWGFDKGAEIVPLRGSTAEINRIERGCATSAPVASPIIAAAQPLAPKYAIDTTYRAQNEPPFDKDVHDAAVTAFSRELINISREENISIEDAFNAYGKADSVLLGASLQLYYALSLMHPVQCGMVACTVLVDPRTQDLLLELDGAWITPLNTVTNGMQDMLVHDTAPDDYTVWSFDGRQYDYANEIAPGELEPPYWLASQTGAAPQTGTALEPAVVTPAAGPAAMANDGNGRMNATPGFEPIYVEDLPAIDPDTPNARGVVAYARKDFEAALALFLEGSEAGDAAAMANAGYMLVTGEYVPSHKSRGLELLENAALAGDGFAMTRLGGFYGSSTFVPGDYAKANQYFAQAMETVAAPDASYLYSAYVAFAPEYRVTEVHTWASKRDEICMFAIRAGTRMGMLTCEGAGFFFDPDMFEDTRVSLEVAMQRCSWYRGLNLEDYYIFDMFLDNNEALYNYVNYVRNVYLEWGHDVGPYIEGGMIVACPEGGRPAS